MKSGAKRSITARAAAIWLCFGAALLCVAPQASALTAQTITGFTPATPITYSTGKTFTLSAKGGASGNPIVYASTTTAVCTVSASTVSVLGTGTCGLTANQAGNTNYAAATQVAASVVVNKGAQTITFATLAAKTYGAAPFTVSATASSGLAVAFTSSTTPVCTVSGSTVTLVGVGTCTIDASQPGNAKFNAATQIARSFAVAKETQTIAFAALAGKSYGVAPFTVSATSSAGLTVSFTSSTASVCTVSGSMVTLTGLGTCTIDANQAGNVDVNAAAQVARSFTVAKETQTITFGALTGKSYGVAPFALTATASSGLPVAYTTSTPSVCTVSGPTATLVGIGTCTIDANQAGNIDVSAAAQVAQSFTVAQESQTIGFAALAGKAIGTAPFTVTATSSAGLAVSLSSSTTPVCTVSGATVTLVSVGTCTIAANQAGNTNVSAAPQVTQSFAVSQQTQTITFGALTGKILGMAPFTVSATTSSGLPVTFTTSTASVCTVSGSAVTLVSTGTCTITANQAGNGTYAAAIQITQSLTVAANVPPTVTLTSPVASQNWTAPATIPLTASAASSDATVAQVQFFSGANLLGTATQAPYSLTWINVPAGNYNVTATATDNLGGVTNSTPVAVTVAPAGTIAITLTSPSAGQALTAPTKLTLTATVIDSVGTITQVAFFNSGSLMGTITQPPYSITLPDAEPGTYVITAQAADSTGLTATSSPVIVTIAAAGGTGTGTGTGGVETVYDIHTDQLNTPRMITDSNGNAVWQWDSTDPFGNSIANQDPNGTGNQFVFNLRFPGQTADVETGLFYNYMRDYDPATGRYVESDPIGLLGGIDTYLYARAKPMKFKDSFGLDVYLCKQPAFGISWNPIDHHWIKTDTTEAGMGGLKGNEPGNASGDLPGDPVAVVDHRGRSKQKGATCEKVNNVDEKKVNDQLKLGTPLGRWGPTNQCQSFAQGVLDNARTVDPMPTYDEEQNID